MNSFSELSFNNLQSDTGLCIFNSVHPAPPIRQSRYVMHEENKEFWFPETNF